MRYFTFPVAFFLACVLLFSASEIVKSSLVVVKSNWNIVVNVLASQDQLEIPQNQELIVTNLLASVPDSHSQISLSKSNGTFVLSVKNDAGEKTLDVTDIKDEVIEIEERPEVDKLSIFVVNDKFSISQGELKATTDYHITVDSQRARILLDTPSGKRFLSIAPKDAVQTLLRAKILSKFDNEIFIEESGSELAYKVSGDKNLNFFNVYTYPVPVTAHVSVLTGEIVVVDQPTWYKILGFLFV